MFDIKVSSPERLRPLYLLVCAALSLLLVSGCSPLTKLKQTAKSFTRHVQSGSAGTLKKQIGIVAFLNKTVFTDEHFEVVLQKHFMQEMESTCSGVRLVETFPPEFTEISSELSRLAPGEFDNTVLAKMGQQLGLNAVVFGSLTHVSEKEEKEGILWFKDTVFYVQLGFTVEVYDTETGSKLLDESFIHELEIDEVDAQNIRQSKEIDIPDILEIIEETGEEMARKTCEAVQDSPWKGFIVGSSGDTVTLSSGQNAGLKNGQRLNVYKRGDIIEGKNGRRFFLPGSKTGEIKIISVSPDRAQAVSVSGEPVAEGASVRVE